MDFCLKKAKKKKINRASASVVADSKPDLAKKVFPLHICFYSNEYSQLQMLCVFQTSSDLDIAAPPVQAPLGLILCLETKMSAALIHRAFCIEFALCKPERCSSLNHCDTRSTIISFPNNLSGLRFLDPKALQLCTLCVG